MKRAGFLTDPQWPYEDKRNYACALNLLSDLRLDEIILGGDCFDFLGAGTYTKDYRLEILVEKELEYGNVKLDEIDKTFKCKKIFLEGNHEYRLEREIISKLPSFVGIITLKGLAFDHRKGWAVHDYEPRQHHRVLGTRVIARHVRLGASPKAWLKEWQTSLIHGHTHRIEYEEIKSFLGDRKFCITPGCLADINHKLFNFAANVKKWGNGVTIYEKQGKEDQATNVEIKNGRCAFNGKTYKA